MVLQSVASFPHLGKDRYPIGLQGLHSVVTFILLCKYNTFMVKIQGRCLKKRIKRPRRGGGGLSDVEMSIGVRNYSLHFAAMKWRFMRPML